MSTVLTGLRERAAETFAKLGWPTTRTEAWRYTNLAPVQKIDWKIDDAPKAIDSAASMSGRAAAEFVFVNGSLVSAPEELPAGVTRYDSRDENTIADWERNAMVALNTVNMQDGALLEVAAGKVVDGFIHLLFVGEGDGVWSHPRNVIVVGSNAQVAIVETYVGSGRYFTNAVTEIVAGESAVVDHYRV
ncbi:MAG TPA: SufD family Fe-S cluster assembly protein, partial [Thermoanaerobaculia bacterium]